MPKKQTHQYSIPFKELTVVWWQDAYITTEDDPDLGEGEHLTISIGVQVPSGKEFVRLSHFYDGISKTLSSPFTDIPVGTIKKIERWKMSRA